MKNKIFYFGKREITDKEECKMRIMPKAYLSIALFVSYAYLTILQKKE